METFIVRVWTPADRRSEGTSVSDLHGTVSAAASGTQTRFASGAELLGVLRSRLPTLSESSGDVR